MTQKTSLAPVLGWDAAKELVEEWRAQGLKVGFTNGTFDILHRGHIAVIDQAAATCDRLIMGMNSDASVKRYKSEDRPINAEADRARVLSALRAIDLVVMFGDDLAENDTPAMIVDLLQPDVIIKGGDYAPDQVVGADTVKARGGEVVIVPFEEGYSTTSTIEKMQASN